MLFFLVAYLTMLFVVQSTSITLWSADYELKTMTKEVLWPT